MSNTTVTQSYKESEIAEMLERLDGMHGLRPESLKSEYESGRFRSSDAVIVVYSSGKVVIQGRGAEALASALDDSSASLGRHFSQDLAPLPSVGSDEVGKGDYFGPLVVAACYVDDEMAPILREYGVVDSKKLTDADMIDMATAVEACTRSVVRVVEPEEYNTLYEKFRNLNTMLEHLHSDVLSRLIEEVETDSLLLSSVVVDQFKKDSRKIRSKLVLQTGLAPSQIIIETKAEKYIAVAAASIVARVAFLGWFDSMSVEYDMELPKGATHILKDGRKFVRRFGVDELKKVAKLHFKSTNKIL